MHAQTGKVVGVRRASMKRAQHFAFGIILAAVALFGLSLLCGLLGIFIPPMLIIGGVGVFFAVLVAVAALFPIARAWQFNRNKPSSIGF